MTGAIPKELYQARTSVRRFAPASPHRMGSLVYVGCEHVYEFMSDASREEVESLRSGPSQHVGAAEYIRGIDIVKVERNPSDTFVGYLTHRTSYPVLSYTIQCTDEEHTRFLEAMRGNG